VRVSERFFFEDFPSGKVFDFAHFPLTRELIDAYIAEFDPLFGGPERDASGGRFASPWQMNALLMRLNYDCWMFEAAGRGSPGVDEARWFRPAAAGDVITGRYTVRSARVLRSKPHLGLVQYFHELFANGGRVMYQLNSVILERKDKEPLIQAPDPSRTQPAPRVEQDTAGIPIPLGERDFAAEDILKFAGIYDPQPFHVDIEAANKGPFGALAASGWHTVAQWASAYAETFDAGRKGLPRPLAVLWMKPLIWKKPVYAGERIAFDFTPLKTERDTSGKTVVTARNRGVDSNGGVVIDFTIGMVVAI
jgi:acyl dehydratase